MFINPSGNQIRGFIRNKMIVYMNNNIIIHIKKKKKK